jgi:hypothetical protein
MGTITLNSSVSKRTTAGLAANGRALKYVQGEEAG